MRTTRWFLKETTSETAVVEKSAAAAEAETEESEVPWGRLLMGGVGRGEEGAAQDEVGVKAIVIATTADRVNNEIFIF